MANIPLSQHLPDDDPLLKPIDLSRATQAFWEGDLMPNKQGETKEIPLSQLKDEHPTCKDCRWWDGPPQQDSGKHFVCLKGEVGDRSPESRLGPPGQWRWGRDKGCSVEIEIIYTGRDYYCPHYEAKA